MAVRNKAGGDETAEVKLKKVKEVKIAYMKHRGAYNKIPFDKYYGKLFAWIKEKHLRPAGPPLGIFYDKPKKVPAKKLRSEIGVPIRGKARSGRGVKVKKIPSATVARITHRGPMKDYGKTYKKLHRWIEEKGYVLAGPAMELCISKPKMVRGKLSIFSVIQAPVKKA